MSDFYVEIPGVPQPQGSMKSYGTGRPMVHSNADTLLPWRASVIAHVRQAMAASPDYDYPIQWPVEVSVTFTLPRPKSAPKSRVYPDRKPDLDKLCRAALDALTGAGLIRDDAQVVALAATKTYGTPGCTIRLSLIEPVTGRAVAAVSVAECGSQHVDGAGDWVCTRGAAHPGLCQARDNGRGPVLASWWSYGMTTP